MNGEMSERPQLNVFESRVKKLDSSAYHIALCSTVAPTAYNVAESTTVSVFESELVVISPRPLLGIDGQGLTGDVVSLPNAARDDLVENNAVSQFDVNTDGLGSSLANSINSLPGILLSGQPSCPMHSPHVGTDASSMLNPEAAISSNQVESAIVPSCSKNREDSSSATGTSRDIHLNLPALTKSIDNKLNSIKTADIEKYVKIKKEKMDEAKIKIEQFNEVQEIKKEQIISTQSGRQKAEDCVTTQVTKATDQGLNGSSDKLPINRQAYSYASSNGSSSSESKTANIRQPLASIPVTTARGGPTMDLWRAHTQPVSSPQLSKISHRSLPGKQCSSIREKDGNLEKIEEFKLKVERNSDTLTLKNTCTTTKSDATFATIKSEANEVTSNVNKQLCNKTEQVTQQVIKQSNIAVTNNDKVPITEVAVPNLDFSKETAQEIVELPKTMTVEMSEEAAIVSTQEGICQTCKINGDGTLLFQSGTKIANSTGSNSTTQDANRQKVVGASNVTMQSNSSQRVDTTIRCQSLTAKQFNRIFRELIITPKEPNRPENIGTTKQLDNQTCTLISNLPLQLKKHPDVSNVKSSPELSNQTIELTVNSAARSFTPDVFVSPYSPSVLHRKNSKQDATSPVELFELCGETVAGSPAAVGAAPRDSPTAANKLTKEVTTSPTHSSGQEKNSSNSSLESHKNSSSLQVTEIKRVNSPDSEVEASTPLNAPTVTEHGDLSKQSNVPTATQRTKLLVKRRGRPRGKQVAKSLSYLKKSTGTPLVNLAKTCSKGRNHPVEQQDTSNWTQSSNKRKRSSLTSVSDATTAHTRGRSGQTTSLDIIPTKQIKTPIPGVNIEPAGHISNETSPRNSCADPDDNKTKNEDLVKPCYISIRRIDNIWMQSTLTKKGFSYILKDVERGTRKNLKSVKNIFKEKGKSSPNERTITGTIKQNTDEEQSEVQTKRQPADQVTKNSSTDDQGSRKTDGTDQEKYPGTRVKDAENGQDRRIKDEPVSPERNLDPGDNHKCSHKKNDLLLSTCHLAKCGKPLEGDLATTDRVFIAFKDDCTTVHFEDPREDGPERYSVTFDSTDTETIVQIRRKRTVDDSLKARSAKQRKVVESSMRLKQEPKYEKDKSGSGKDATYSNQSDKEGNIIKKDIAREVMTEVAAEKDNGETLSAEVLQSGHTETHSCSCVPNNIYSKKVAKLDNSGDKDRAKHDVSEVVAGKDITSSQKVGNEVGSVTKDGAKQVIPECVTRKSTLFAEKSRQEYDNIKKDYLRRYEMELEKSVHKQQIPRSSEDDNAVRDVIEILDDESAEPAVLPVITNAYSLREKSKSQTTRNVKGTYVLK